jgi:hypothetical protein
MQTVILVPGTWGGKNDWSCEGSPFRRYLETRGFNAIQFRGWSGDVDGLYDPLENGSHSDWRAGGWALRYLLARDPHPIIGHSHAGQVIAYCAAETRTPISALVTVCTPVRKDMEPSYREASLNIGHWRHVYASGWDLLQRAGELFDGHIGWVRQMAEAHDNVGIPKIGHSRLFDDPAQFHWWEDAGLLDVLRAPVF